MKFIEKFLIAKHNQEGTALGRFLAGFNGSNNPKWTTDIEKAIFFTEREAETVVSDLEKKDNIRHGIWVHAWFEGADK